MTIQDEGAERYCLAGRRSTGVRETDPVRKRKSGSGWELRTEVATGHAFLKTGLGRIPQRCIYFASCCRAEGKRDFHRSRPPRQTRASSLKNTVAGRRNVDAILIVGVDTVVGANLAASLVGTYRVTGLYSTQPILLRHDPNPSRESHAVRGLMPDPRGNTDRSDNGVPTTLPAPAGNRPQTRATPGP